MSDLEIEECILSKDTNRALELCTKGQKYFLGLFIKQFDENFVDRSAPVIRIMLVCNWCTTEQLVNLWNKMSKGNFTWNNIQIVMNEPADYYVVINSAPKEIVIDPKKTIVFRMEPHMDKNPIQWGEWANPDSDKFLKIFKHANKEYNNIEWHLSKTYQELSTMKIEKNPEFDSIISTVLSAKYKDPGHVKRIDFVRFLEKKGMKMHVYGDNKWNYKDYKGSLPYHCKDQAIFPYKYIFNAENHNIDSYFTEKLVDGILGECLVFYYGCFNIKEYLDERAFVHLELSNFEKDYEIITRAIKEDWHSKRLPYIREAKKKILEDMQFFPRLEKIINQFKTENSA